MKHILVGIVSLLMFVSCGKSKKEDVVKQEVTSTKTVNKATKPSAVTVDANGVANVLVTTNDIMKFNVKEIKVKAGQKVKITLSHTGKLDKKVMGHNIVILNKGVKISAFAVEAAAAKDNDYIPEGTKDVIANTKMIGGGETTTIEFIAPEVGSYDFICSFPAHFAMMKGKFIVE